ncbi:MAG: RIP metalloprotease RseP [Candidatus Paceibacterota bacterium]|jgi:regulator of sigma E protease
MNILLFAIILAVLVLVHEFGHFIVAKKSGIRVDEFGIGFPPKLYGKKYGETEYTINAIPFGGFVKIFGENPDEESTNGPGSERSFVNKPKLTQVAVLSAGVFFNLLFAWALLTSGFLIGLPSSDSEQISAGTISNVSLTVVEVMKDTPAQIAGMQTGDKILSVSFEKEASAKVTPEAFQKFVNEHDAKEISVLIRRGSEEKTVLVTPKRGIVKGGKSAIGIAMDMVGVMRLPAHRAVYEGGRLTLLYTQETFRGLYHLLANALRGKGDMSSVSGPVGIVKIVGDASQLGITYLISLTALISINLAVINILPIPALDGGRVFFILIETIKRSPIKAHTANLAHSIGFVVLIGLIIVITFHDVWTLFAK